MPSLLTRQFGPPPTGPIDLSTNAPSILAINGVFCGITLVVMLARLYVRTVILKSVGTDDWLILAATICGAGVLACFVGETHNGVGMHTRFIKPDAFGRILHWQYFHSLIVTVGISLVKLSVGFFLLRLIPGKKQRIFLYCVIAFLTAFTLSSAGTIMFSCIPIRASWDRAGEPNAKCFSSATFTNIGLFNSVVNILTDVLFATLPVPIVWNLQVNMRTKISLLTILSLGYFACACSIVKTVYQVHVFADPDSTRNDSYFIWNSVELYVGLLAASLPALRPLFRRLLDTTRTLRTKVTGNSSNAQRHKYYMHDDGGIAMGSLGPGVSRHSKYDVRVTTRSKGGMGQSEEDLRSLKGKGEGSQEDILPIQGRGDKGIMKTVDVRVT